MAIACCVSFSSTSTLSVKMISSPTSGLARVDANILSPSSASSFLNSFTLLQLPPPFIFSHIRLVRRSSSSLTHLLHCPNGQFYLNRNQRGITPSSYHPYFSSFLSPSPFRPRFERLSTACDTEAEAMVEEGERREEGEGERFVWAKNWYPIAVLRDLDPSAPTAMSLLGIPLVIWKEGGRKGRREEEGGVEGQWRVFVDMCPHRLAPLSEGRIHESGELQCSYHGWTFRGDGKCGMIPQAKKDNKAYLSPRSCARSLPSLALQGMLWVWPDWEGGEGEAERKKRDIPIMPELDDPSFRFDLLQADFKYSYEMLLENLADPAHVPFAHHRIMSNRNLGKPLDLRVQSISQKGIFGVNERGDPFSIFAPFLIRNELVLRPKAKEAAEREEAGEARGETAAAGRVKSEKLQGVTVNVASPSDPTSSSLKRLVLLFYCIPIAPGRSRLLVAFPGNFFPPVLKLIPRWFSHRSTMSILDSDHFFLHVLQRRLREEQQVEEGREEAREDEHEQVVGEGREGTVAGKNKSSSSDAVAAAAAATEGARGNKRKDALEIYYAPCRSDAFVLGFRRWMREHAEGGEVRYFQRRHLNDRGNEGTGEKGDPPPLPLPALLSKEEVLNRQPLHVSICSSCRSALAAFRSVRSLLFALSFSCMARAIWCASAPLAAVALSPHSSSKAVLLPFSKRSLPSFFSLPSSLTFVLSSRLSPSQALIWVFLSAAALLAAVSLSRFIQRTYFYQGYTHALVN